MAIRISNLMKTIDFEWDKDPDKGTDKASVWRLRTLDAYEQAWINDRMTTMEDADFSGIDLTDEAAAEAAVGRAMSTSRVEAYKAAINATRIALVEVINVFDDDGEPVELKMVHERIAGKTKLIADLDFVRALPVNLCMAIYNRVQQANTVSETERKNSKAA